MEKRHGIRSPSPPHREKEPPHNPKWQCSPTYTDVTSRPGQDRDRPEAAAQFHHSVAAGGKKVHIRIEEDWKKHLNQHGNQTHPIFWANITSIPTNDSWKTEVQY